MRVLAHLQVLEVVSAMRVVKYFCYEGSFLNEIFNIRKQELKGIKKIQHSQSSNRGSFFSFFPVAGGTEKRVGKVTKNPEITERGQQRKCSLRLICVS
ncbi:hypothetical protein B0H14DRAFT_3450093 [Mycena olivaceomarginata]|nr:hypothetical protein B0H14DRAFT_3450093 [Mycena olivaceomarginata]